MVVAERRPLTGILAAAAPGTGRHSLRRASLPAGGDRVVYPQLQAEEPWLA